MKVKLLFIDNKGLHHFRYTVGGDSVSPDLITSETDWRVLRKRFNKPTKSYTKKKRVRYS